MAFLGYLHIRLYYGTKKLEFNMLNKVTLISSSFSTITLIRFIFSQLPSDLHVHLEEYVLTFYKKN